MSIPPKKAKTPRFRGEVEIVEFYPDPKKGFVGTMHIYLPEFLMDVRGILVLRYRGKYFFKLPQNKGTDENGKVSYYPILSFSDPIRWKMIIRFLQQEGPAYVDNILKEKGLGK